MPYKKSKGNSSKCLLRSEHQDYFRKLLDEDPQLNAVNIIEKLSEQFMGLSTTKGQLNHHMRITMLISVKKPTFKPAARNLEANLQEGYDWYMQWKDTDLDVMKNCIFINESGFNINMRNNWARPTIGTSAKVVLPKTRTVPRTIIGVIHCSSVIHVTLKKPPPKKGRAKKNDWAVVQKKRKVNKRKKRGHR